MSTLLRRCFGEGSPKETFHDWLIKTFPSSCVCGFCAEGEGELDGWARARAKAKAKARAAAAERATYWSAPWPAETAYVHCATVVLE